MIIFLGKRFITKYYKHNKDLEEVDSDEIEEELQNLKQNIFEISELKILQNIAYYSFIEGDNLIFKGASEDKSDQNTI